MFPFNFRNKDLEKKALTLAVGRKSALYERLEFLGDRVLALCISDILYRTYPKEKEGDLAHRFTYLVRAETLAEIALFWGINKRLITNEKSLCQNSSVLSDVCEALLGAFYLDSGYEEVYKIIKKFWSPFMKTHKKPPKDPKTNLQELVQKKDSSLPTYQTIRQTGPSHCPVFEIKVTTSCFGEAIGIGSSKREAEQNAAIHLLESLKK